MIKFYYVNQATSESALFNQLAINIFNLKGQVILLYSTNLKAKKADLEISLRA